MLRVRSPSLFIPADRLHSLPNSTSPGVLKRVLVLPLSWCCLRPRNTHLTAGGENFGGYSPVSHASSRAIVRSSGCCGEVARGSTERVGGTGAP